MLKVTIYVAAPTGTAQGVKESLAMELERFGDCRVVSVEEISYTKQQTAPMQGNSRRYTL